MFNHLPNSFTAWMLRIRNIERWTLIKAVQAENCTSHCFEVAIIAHQLSCIVNKVNASDPIALNDCITAMYHEASEPAGMSDLPTPVKYANEAIQMAIKDLEHNVEMSLINNATPEPFRDTMTPLIVHKYTPKHTKMIVKAADIYSMFVKADFEFNTLNNSEFFITYPKLLQRAQELNNSGFPLNELNKTGAIQACMKINYGQNENFTLMAAIVAHQMALTGKFYFSRTYNPDEVAGVILYGVFGNKDIPNKISGDDLDAAGKALTMAAAAFTAYYVVNETVRTQTSLELAYGKLHNEELKMSLALLKKQFEDACRECPEADMFFSMQGKLCLEGLSAITSEE